MSNTAGNISSAGNPKPTTAGESQFTTFAAATSQSSWIMTFKPSPMSSLEESKQRSNPTCSPASTKPQDIMRISSLINHDGNDVSKDVTHHDKMLILDARLRKRLAGMVAGFKAIDKRRDLMTNAGNVNSAKKVAIAKNMAIKKVRDRVVGLRARGLITSNRHVTQRNQAKSTTSG
ncbi:hypothetical protein P280DRAFT_513341 [Massarina eburnea CBS 473.64]|uniref:Uncharacterized protein n=1 Tax=Massarina eburnea CBS 473.64 TaxID=1395130 RepID=A0A6A6SGS9_9PLEO|nr:hypothetical protein P280DRAFT_513341 [Massarina eburnea CBS 473.64]